MVYMTDTIEAITKTYQRKAKGEIDRSEYVGHVLSDAFAWALSLLLFAGIYTGFIALANILENLDSSTSINSDSMSSSRARLREILSAPVGKVREMSAQSTPKTRELAEKMEKHIGGEWRQVKEVSPSIIPNKTQIEKAARKVKEDFRQSELQAIE